MQNWYYKSCRSEPPLLHYRGGTSSKLEIEEYMHITKSTLE